MHVLHLHLLIQTLLSLVDIVEFSNIYDGIRFIELKCAYYLKPNMTTEINVFSKT